VAEIPGHSIRGEPGSGSSRRRFLRWSAGIPFALRRELGLALPPDEELVQFNDYGLQFAVEAQADNPRIKCFDLRRLTSSTTSSSDFFEFHQTQTIRAEAGDWRLRIGGLVRRPAEFSLQDLLNRAGRRELAVTIECSGNSGDPRLMNGLVSNAVWTGVSLAAILKECVLEPEAREVVFLGMDSEEEKKWEAGNATFPSPHGRSIYVQDAQSPENLLAFGMNGKPLPAEHGFPLRLVLPGWYGAAQVKWLTRIEVIDRRYEGRHMARNYQSLRAVKTPTGTLWLDTSISRNNLKSVIARVTRRRIGGRFEYKVAGAAWGGPAKIESVEVQVDGEPWRPAHIEQPGAGPAWLLWTLDWRDAAPGPHTLVSRATNARREIQPTRSELRDSLISNREDNSQWVRSVVIESGG
jgi:DMSO/TMAO reductase YedYZ molybdopterin-dependent catalytic subunit